MKACALGIIIKSPEAEQEDRFQTEAKDSCKLKLQALKRWCELII